MALESAGVGEGYWSRGRILGCGEMGGIRQDHSTGFTGFWLEKLTALTIFSTIWLPNIFWVVLNIIPCFLEKVTCDNEPSECSFPHPKLRNHFLRYNHFLSIPE